MICANFSSVFTHQKKCRICGSEQLTKVLDLGHQPPANAFLAKKDFNKESHFPLRVYFCRSCSLLQLLDVVSPELLFGKYVYVSSTSPSFVAHFESYAQEMANRFDIKGRLIVDLGSNDGILLRPLKNLGAVVLGIDPAKSIARRATVEGLETIPNFFSPQLAKKLLARRNKAKLITANNVFAHIDNSAEVVKGVKILLADDGVFVIEVPYLVDFLKNKLFDTIYHEHLSYFSLKPLKLLMEKNGMEIFDVKKVGSHGGSIRIFIQKLGGIQRVSQAPNDFLMREKKLGLHKISTYHNFARDVRGNRDALFGLLTKLKKGNHKIAGYGAPAKGNTLLNYADINNVILDYIVDDSPYKQGLYTPGGHIPVVSFAELAKNPPDFLLILAWNFAEQIMDKCRNFRQNGGKFIVPIPEPKII